MEGSTDGDKYTGFFRSASGFMNILVAALKTIAEHYPGRLHKAFVIDPPSIFPYLWKVFYLISLSYLINTLFKTIQNNKLNVTINYDVNM